MVLQTLFTKLTLLCHMSRMLKGLNPDGCHMWGRKCSTPDFTPLVFMFYPIQYTMCVLGYDNGLMTNINCVDSNLFDLYQFQIHGQLVKKMSISGHMLGTNTAKSIEVKFFSYVFPYFTFFDLSTYYFMFFVFGKVISWYCVLRPPPSPLTPLPPLI